MKFSATALFLVSLCLVDLAVSLNVPRSTSEPSLSRRTPVTGGKGKGKDKGGPSDKGGRSSKGGKDSGKGGKGGKGGQGRSGGGRSVVPCSSMEQLSTTPVVWHCKGNGKPSAMGLRRPDSVQFENAPISKALKDLENGVTFTTAAKMYPAKFVNAGGSGKMFAQAGDDLMEFPIFVKGYANPNKAGAFRVIFSQNRKNNECKFVGITEHLNGGHVVDMCENGPGLRRTNSLKSTAGESAPKTLKQTGRTGSFDTSDKTKVRAPIVKTGGKV